MSQFPIVETEAAIHAAGINYKRGWEKLDPNAPDLGAEYGNVARVDGAVIASGCMRDLQAGVIQWWSDQSNARSNDGARVDASVPKV